MLLTKKAFEKHTAHIHNKLKEKNDENHFQQKTKCKFIMFNKQNLKY